MATESRSRRSAKAATSPPSGGGAAALIFPIGHFVGSHYRVGEAVAARQVRRGASFHDLTDDEFAVWTAAHGTRQAVMEDVPWRRSALEAEVSGVQAGQLVDKLSQLGLLVEVAPGTDQAVEFARSHRLEPLMLGLGNSAENPDTFGIGFLHQPVMEVSHGIYDLWQWAAMDDSLWGTCENAADVARRAGATDADSLEPARLLNGFLGSLHALLLVNAAYLDVGFRLRWPEVAMAPAGTGSVADD